MMPSPRGRQVTNNQIATAQVPFELASPGVFLENTPSSPADYAPVMHADADTPPDTIISTGANDSQIYIPLKPNNVVQLRFVMESSAVSVLGHIYSISEEIGYRANGERGLSYSAQLAAVLTSGASAGSLALSANHIWAEQAGLDPATLFYADEIVIDEDYTFGEISVLGPFGTNGIQTIQFDYTGHVGLLFVGGASAANKWNIAKREI